MKKSYLAVYGENVEHTAESLKRLAEAEIKPNKTNAWLFLQESGKNLCSEGKELMLVVHSPKHVMSIHQMLTRVTLQKRTKFDMDPELGWFIDMTGEWLRDTVIDVIKSMNIPKDEYTITIPPTKDRRK